MKSTEVSLVKRDIEKMEVERKSCWILMRIEKRECRARSEERIFKTRSMKAQSVNGCSPKM